MSRYALSITFKSNEHPFSMTYDSVRPLEDEADALDWQRGMSEGLGDSYMVTLLRDGEPVIAHPDSAEGGAEDGTK